MAKKEYNNDLELLIDQLHIELGQQPPVQKVVPVDKPAAPSPVKQAESQLAVWIPKELYKQAKMHSAESELSLKEITIKALEQYLNNKA